MRAVRWIARKIFGLVKWTLKWVLVGGMSLVIVGALEFMGLFPYVGFIPRTLSRVYQVALATYIGLSLTAPTRPRLPPPAS